MLARTGLAVIIAAALAASATAKTESDTRLNCPDAAAARIDALQAQVDTLSDKLDQLDDRLDQLADVRNAALDTAKSRIEQVVHDESLSQEQIDREVARALATAQTRGEETARSARELHEAMTQVRTRMDVLRQQMRALAARDPHRGADAG